MHDSTRDYMRFIACFILLRGRRDFALSFYMSLSKILISFLCYESKKVKSIDSLSILFFIRHKLMKSKSSHQVFDNLRIQIAVVICDSKYFLQTELNLVMSFEAQTSSEL